MEISMKKIHGIIPIMQTPFTADGSDVDYEDFGRMCDATVRDGSGGIALFGYGTEFYKLSDDERDKMVQTAVKSIKGKAPIIASITAGSTETGVKTAKRYEELGVDAIMVLSPGVVPPSTQALAQHIITIGNSVKLPNIIQYTPGSGGGKLTPESIAKICEEIKNEVYIKAEAIPVGPFIDAIREATKGKLGLFSGNMCLFMIDLMDRGVTGFMPGVSLVPVFNEIFKEYLDGNKERAWQIYNAAAPMVNFIGQDIEVLVKYEKMMMVKRGIIKNSYCRKPTAFPEDPRIWKIFDNYRENLKAIVNVGKDYTW
jgi:4-hydroxy-tetrahydrodipicolinate synthase